MWFLVLGCCLLVSATEEPAGGKTEAIREGTMTTKPTMHTYFDRIPPEERFTGMEDEDDDKMIVYWKEAWEEAGWDTRILTVEDAKKHPQFAEFDTLLRSMKLDAFGNICYYKYLAMAAIGGGWMADYDVYPLRDFRSVKINHNTDDMVIYDIVRASLASGSASGYLKLGNSLLQLGKDRIELESPAQASVPVMINHMTDEMPMHTIVENRTQYNWVQSMTKVLSPPFIKSTIDPIDPAICTHRAMRKHHIALHMSPRNVQHLGVPPELRFPKYRVEAAKLFREDFVRVCNVTIFDVM